MGVAIFLLAGLFLIFLLAGLFLAVLVIAAGAALANEVSMKTPRQIGRNAAREAMGDLEPQIHQALDAALMPMIVRHVEGLYRKSPRFRFIKHMQAEMQRVFPSMTDKDAFDTARRTLWQHLEDEGIEFGDDRYSWDKDGAIDLIHACEIEYWDEG